MTLSKELALGNGARPFNYKIQITLPSVLNGGLTADATINALCTNTRMPGSKLNTRDYYIDGRVIKLPGTLQQDQTWDCTFYLDDSYYVRRVVENWINILDTYFMRNKLDTAQGGVGGVVNSLATKVLGMFSRHNDAQAASPANPATGAMGTLADTLAGSIGFMSPKADTVLSATATVTQIGYTGTNIAFCTMYNLFPIEIGAIEFADEQNAVIGSFRVTFAYSHHEYTRQVTGIEKVGDLVSQGVGGVVNGVSTVGKSIIDLPGNILEAGKNLFKKP